MHKLLCIILIFACLNSHAFVFYENTKVWNQDTITFYFLDGTPKQQSEVQKFAKFWQRYSGIKFLYSTNKSPFFSFKKYYKITFKGGSNQSTRGAINGIIHLGSLSENIIFRKTTVLHEFGHMLGLGHEHQRADRPAYLDDNELIYACKKTQKQSRQWCKENMSNITKADVFIESEYDQDSIMHYRMENITGKKPQDKQINTNSLSYIDKYYIAMLYNQNIADKTLEKMHRQDIWLQQKFETKANKERESSIMNLSTTSCKPLEYPNASKDGKYCDSGFMIIGKDDYSIPNPEFRTCHNSLKDITEIIKSHPLCQLSTNELYQQRKKWNNQFAQFGNCKRLETKEKNNQEFYCKEGFSYVTNNNDLIGKKTQCYSSEESIYLAMQEDPVCSMTKLDFLMFQRKAKKGLTKKMQTPYCKIVKKKYKSINCPVNYDYTIINLDIQSKPINDKCFASIHQAINAMNLIDFCHS